MEKENNKLFGIFKFDITGDWITFFGSIIPFFLVIGNIINFLIEYFYFISNDISTEFIEFNLMILLKNSIFFLVIIIFIPVLISFFTFFFQIILLKIPKDKNLWRKAFFYFIFYLFHFIYFILFYFFIYSWESFSLFK